MRAAQGNSFLPISDRIFESPQLGEHYAASIGLYAGIAYMLSHENAAANVFGQEFIRICQEKRGELFPGLFRGQVRKLFQEVRERVEAGPLVSTPQSSQNDWYKAAMKEVLKTKGLQFPNPPTNTYHIDFLNKNHALSLEKRPLLLYGTCLLSIFMQCDVESLAVSMKAAEAEPASARDSH